MTWETFFKLVVGIGITFTLFLAVITIAEYEPVDDLTRYQPEPLWEDVEDDSGDIVITPRGGIGMEIGDGMAIDLSTGRLVPSF